MQERLDQCQQELIECKALRKMEEDGKDNIDINSVSTQLKVTKQELNMVRTIQIVHHIHSCCCCAANGTVQAFAGPAIGTEN